MQILIMPWPLAIFGSRLLNNAAISSLLKVIAELDLSVFLQKLKGRSLELFIIEHCLVEKQLNNSALLLKSATYLFS